MRQRRAEESVEAYRGCLLEEDTFAAWTLEAITAAIQRCTQGDWIDRFFDRYLNFEKLA